MSSIISGLSSDHIAERAKRELDEAEAAVENAQRQLQEAEELHARAKERFVEADLQRDCSWNKMYRKLLQYKAENDEILVLTTKDSPTDVKKLAKWVQNQRVHYKYFMNGDKKHIKEHRIEALNRVGFVWNILEHAWNSNFSSLESYHAEHGNFDIPKRQSAKLNSFLTNLRKAMRRKKEGLFQKELNEERINRLNSIDFVWEMKNPARQRGGGENVQFDHLYDLLVNFKETYGHVQVSKMMPIWRGGDEKPAQKEYKRLPFFIASVRSEHEQFVEGKPCALDEEKVQKLTELGIKWKKPASEPRRSCGAKRKNAEKADIDDDFHRGDDDDNGETTNDGIPVDNVEMANDGDIKIGIMDNADPIVEI